MENQIIKILVEITDDKRILENKDIDLIETEILDSLAFIEFVSILEEQFNVEIQPTQVSPSTWRNVKNIQDMIVDLMRKEEHSF